MTIVNVLLREDFRQLAELRLREAEVLQTGGLFDGALYLGGFAVECALKACIARGMAAFQFPDATFANRVNTHHLDTLLREAGLDRELESASVEIRDSWAIVRDWRVEWRYETGKSEAECRDFLTAVGGQDGALQWLRRFW